ncbi:hypothetical protein Y695_04786 [Hydrogenophaga sp. T4]|nr:hypothetical protein Y695_04786 [Hydrogenophaga sp. T4]
MVSSYQVSTHRPALLPARASCSAEGPGELAKASFIRCTTDLRCLKFSMNWAACVRRLRTLCGTLTLAVMKVARSSGVAGTLPGSHSDNMSGPM